MDQIMQEMFDEFSEGDEIFLPSKFWKVLNEKNVRQLEIHGIENLKQTVAQNYFTWVTGRRDEQFRYLARNTPVISWPRILIGQPVSDIKVPLSWRQRIVLAVFTRMLWAFVERIDSERLLDRICEPETGNPFKIFFRGKLISQDLANSVLEYYSVREQFRVSNASPVTICEIGAGYGRNAFVFLQAFPKSKYIIIDIPPALYVSQAYLTSVFPNKKVFKFRGFNDYSEIERAFEDAEVVFLLPHQAKLLPEKSVDLFINISSLHEMQMRQIEEYFKLIDKLTRGYFYSKQWAVSKNPEDAVVITKNDYPVPGNWREIYSRPAKVQIYFFEAMYEIAARNLR